MIIHTSLPKSILLLSHNEDNNWVQTLDQDQTVFALAREIASTLILAIVKTLNQV
jgi:hypothetical protein